MTAVACLRVIVGSPPAGMTPSALAAVVAKVGRARLEKSWAWPRRHGLVAPFSFVLADPSVEQLDASELTRLAADLQRTLFGAEASGQVALLLFQGEQIEMMRLAATTPEGFEAMLSGAEGEALPGKIMRITPAGVQEIGAARAALHVAHARLGTEPAPVAPTAPPLGEFVSRDRADVGFWGVYFLTRERFIGSAVNWPPLQRALRSGRHASPPRTSARDDALRPRTRPRLA
ncbi:hypothetical protein BH09PSE2_BH09PSE2_09440 [soil metagenome]